MPQTTILVFRKANGDVPLTDWLQEIPMRARAKCIERVLQLASFGNELSPPMTKLLRDGVYELRAKIGTVNYRILYFFHGKNVAVLSQGFTKESVVPPARIDEAVRHKRLVEKDADTHTAEFEI